MYRKHLSLERCATFVVAQLSFDFAGVEVALASPKYLARAR